MSDAIEHVTAEVLASGSAWMGQESRGKYLGLCIARTLMPLAAYCLCSARLLARHAAREVAAGAAGPKASNDKTQKAAQP